MEFLKVLYYFTIRKTLHLLIALFVKTVARNISDSI